MSTEEKQYDVIIVGAGSAGCAAAYRLAKSSSLEVLLLEAGSPANNPAMHIPMGFAFLLKEHSNNWFYTTRPEAELNNRTVELPRGKVLGGCSAINGMVYVRGQKEDYDRWASLGNEGWSYEECLPFFKISEDNENGASQYHGVGGPLWVGNVKNEFPIASDYIRASEQAGHKFNPDINAIKQEGVAWFPHNIKRGRRISSATAFLKAGKSLSNLTVLPYAETRKVIIEGNRAVGVECLVKGKETIFKARKEVLISGGAINSPKILELSGIGQKSILEKLGIPVVLDLPGVGENLHDHWNSYIKQEIKGEKNYYTEAKPLAFLKNFIRYLLTGKSFLGNPAALIAVFYKAHEQAERADSQIHFAPAASEVDAKGNMVPIDAVTAAACGVRPTSRGSSHIVSNDLSVKPDITLNFLQTEYDKKVAIESFKKAREIFQQAAFAKYQCREIEPGVDVQTDEQILNYIRQTGEPVHHVAGTCKMGNDELAVVDNKLRVHGIENLRVADASIMPEIISGNTHAPCVMIGERVADFILKS